MFKKFAPAALSGALLVGASLPATATTYEYRMVVNTVHVTVSCFRGPFSEVIWDRPNPVFIDSLVNAGYTFPEAHAIGERVCRDPSTVDRPDAAVQVMYQIIAENPPGR
ncbi:hypothetical protein [Gymnodinialimonas hymeniacidonis]|uniref:hypothetical protein n=1 Tax=Gymnodinialimonas hymeniacidonis TaxID=3126508 RepID=UPI0034C6BC03